MASIIPRRPSTPSPPRLSATATDRHLHLPHRWPISSFRPPAVLDSWANWSASSPRCSSSAMTSHLRSERASGVWCSLWWWVSQTLRVNVTCVVSSNMRWIHLAFVSTEFYSDHRRVSLQTSRSHKLPVKTLRHSLLKGAWSINHYHYKPKKVKYFQESGLFCAE